MQATITPEPSVAPQSLELRAAERPRPRVRTELDPLRLFVRQPLTLSDESGRQRVDGVLEVLDELSEEVHLEFLNGREAQSDDTFRRQFEERQGVPFSPKAFRRARLQRLGRADAMLVVRTALSESGAFEVSYNIFGGHCAPIFFAVWKGTPIRTTLLQELEELCDVTYVEFDDPEELRRPMAEFLHRVADTRVGVEPDFKSFRESA